MKQQVDVTIKLSLWLDAAMDEDDIVTHVRSSLPIAFGEELTAMTNPVDILDVKQEAEIYGNEDPHPSGFVAYQLAPDHDVYGADAGKFIVTSAEHEQEYSGPMGEKDAKCMASFMNALLFVRNWFNDNGLAETYFGICAHIDEELAAAATSKEAA